MLKELTNLTEAAIKIQAAFIKKADLGLAKKDIPSVDGLIPLEFISNAYEFYEYKRLFDIIYLDKTYSQIKHDYMILENTSPTLAVSSVFTPLELSQKPDGVERIILNIFPLNGNTIVVFSCIDEDEQYLRNYIEDIKKASGYYKMYLISKMVLRNCENFALAPKYFSTFTEEKKSIIKQYYYKTIFSDLKDFDNENLFLF